MDPLADLPQAAGAPACRARLRGVPEDFQVDEVMGFEPSGAGPHAYLLIRKRGFNSQELARRLARLAGVPLRDVGLAGLKDRDAVTTQWFSVLVQDREPDWGGLEEPGIEVITVLRHRKKLRRGVHRENLFRIVLRDLEGPWQDLEQRMARVAETGVPNYFGDQRFGRDGANLEEARRLLAGEVRVAERQRRGLYLSAARSFLFNRVLARRVEAGNWDRPLAGDVMNLDGRHGVFAIDEPEAETVERARRGEVHPTGPLWGRGGIRPAAAAAAIEQAALADQRWWCEALERFGLDMDRRALRLMVEDLELERGTDGSAVLSFGLRSGGFATTVLRELVSVAG